LSLPSVEKKHSAKKLFAECYIFDIGKEVNSQFVESSTECKKHSAKTLCRV
jgi:hypothetical protein